MYTICRQIHSPTAVEHCLYCNFFNSNEKQLVVASGSELKIYRLIGETLEESNKATISEETVTKDVKVKVRLECLKSVSLYCEICCLQSVRLGNSTRDSLLLSFSGIIS
jgi:UPI00017B0BFA related cluster